MNFRCDRLFRIVVILSVSVLYSIHNAVTTLAPIVVQKELLWEGGSTAEVASYRIPIITNLPDGSLLAFAEARKFSSSDAGAKFLTLRRGLSDGSLWKPVEMLVEDYQTPDGLNLGAVLVDNVEGSLIVLYSYCIHETCSGKNNGTYLYMIKSMDWGFTWSEPVDVTVKNPKLKGFPYAPGPGYGIQKMLAPNKGRLVVCGQQISPHGEREGLYCLTSDDHGTTWNIGATVIGLPFNVSKKAGDFAPSESQVIELKNGSLVAYTRNTYAYHCSCKVVSLSDDGGDTFPIQHVYLDEVLIDPGCAGSALLHNGILYHVNPSSTSGRVNLTLRWSENEGMTWDDALIIDPGFSGYSCLSAIDDNNIGIVYETAGYDDITFVKVQLHQ